MKKSASVGVVEFCTPEDHVTGRETLLQAVETTEYCQLTPALTDYSRGRSAED